MGYNVAFNPIGTVTNAPLASAPGNELHPLILSMLVIHGGQVKIEKEISSRALSQTNKCSYHFLQHHPQFSFPFLVQFLQIFGPLPTPNRLDN